MSANVRNTMAKFIAAFLTIGLLVWAWQGMEFEPSKLSRAVSGLQRILSDMFPPDWSQLPNAFRKLLETVRIAIVGTALGLIFALPLSFLAARGTVIPMFFSTIIKTILNMIRAVPIIIFAVVFAGMVGLGPFPGALAVGVGSFVMLTKLFAETLEGAHPAPIEAVKAVGGSPLQVFAYGMLPQALPQFLSQIIYAWEINIAAATVTGILGAGGIGYELRTLIGYAQWHQAVVYIIVLIAMVLLADNISYQVRKRVN